MREFEQPLGFLPLAVQRLPILFALFATCVVPLRMCLSLELRFAG